MKLYLQGFILLFSFTLFCSSLSGQSKFDSLQTFTGKHNLKHEILFDFRNFYFNSPFSGLRVMYKKLRKKDGQFYRDKRYNTRFLLSLDTHLPLGEQLNSVSLTEAIRNGELILTPGDISGRLEVPQRLVEITTGIGVEKQVTLDKLIFYRGIDFEYGYTFFDENSISFLDDRVVPRINISSFNSSFSFHLFQLHPFIGMRYFFSKRISLSIETGFHLGYYIGNSALIRSPIETRFHGIVSGFDNVRFLSLSIML